MHVAAFELSMGFGADAAHLLRASHPPAVDQACNYVTYHPEVTT
jgi:hypothetical protein